MTAEIICVGTELLLGDILNTNAQFLSQQLAELGINVHFQSVVGDNAARLQGVVETALRESDLLVFSGGLGPTEDDLTKQTVAKAFGDEMQFDAEEYEKIKSFFVRWHRTMPANNRKQAMVPLHGRKLVNGNGTAPGAIFEKDGKYAVLLPGPPKELQPMFINEVKPWLASLSDSVLYSLTLRECGIGESHLEEKIGALLQNANPTAAVYAKTAEVVIRITAKAKTQQEAKAMCRAYAEKFYDVLGDAIYGEDIGGIETAIVQKLQEKKQTVATAESCTGGILSKRLTDVSGSSDVFGFGFCTYAAAAKEQLLGVPHETIAGYGVVSEQTAAAMAYGAMRVAGSDYALATTGVAGPGGGTQETPVGTVYVAVCDAGGVYVQRLSIANRPRASVREFAAQYALDMLRRIINGVSLPGCQYFSRKNAVKLDNIPLQDT